MVRKGYCKKKKGPRKGVFFTKNNINLKFVNFKAQDALRSDLVLLQTSELIIGPHDGWWGLIASIYPI